MTDAATTRHIAMLEQLTDCVGALAVTAHDLAMVMVKHSPDRFLALAAESRQCAFAARMGVKLIHRLKAGPPLAARPASPAAPEARPVAERAAPERAAAEREQDRESESESEPASLPLFLKTLRAVASDAERRKAELPAAARETALPTLHALLAKAEASGPPSRQAPAPAAVPRTSPAAAPAASTRSRLLASTLAAPAPGPRRDSG